MNRCLMTYDQCEGDYSRRGLNLLSRQLTTLNPLPYSAQEQVDESFTRSGKMSIQGVQPKLSARLRIKRNEFEIVNMGGRYILKPQHPHFKEIPENEDLTMKLAKMVGLDTPVHGLIRSKDNSLTYLIKRFDRVGQKNKIQVEDFAQLSNETRDTKYDSSMEKVAGVLEFCTFPVLEKIKLFKIMVFAFLVGNGDMHLKNFSLISRKSKIELSPLYDQINTAILTDVDSDEFALPLHGKKRNLTYGDFFKYFANGRLNLPQFAIVEVRDTFQNAIQKWKDAIEVSFLSDELKQAYWEMIQKRRSILKC